MSSKSPIYAKDNPKLRIAAAPGTPDLWRVEKHMGGKGVNAGMKDKVKVEHFDPWVAVRRPIAKVEAYQQMMNMEAVRNAL
jgi:hypothetical protein